ncbi:MAG: hypothetical protein IJJ59_10220 [Pseudobutyrivibrio sp.]|uniref:hypothetical protein n=1 Tax=Pseudobutyrivibrio sp. TaxID=2014367 RepID=UPI0025F1FE55|nr:hypothetical protein [Pseudobutyrivibrio sp.]MBQ6463686.1 hypothetical protein [Pseudobutyrivibrio sp.]
MMSKKATIILLVVIAVLSILRAVFFPSNRYGIDRDDSNAYTEYLKKNNIEQKR